MTWVEAIELALLLALAVQVWKLHLRLSRLERGASPSRGSKPAVKALRSPGSGLFATLVRIYAEAPYRQPSRQARPPEDHVAAASARPPAISPEVGARSALGPGPGPQVAGRAGSSTGRSGEPAPAVAPGSNPDIARVAELLRQGLDRPAIARQLGLATGEVEVLEGLARAKGLLP